MIHGTRSSASAAAIRRMAIGRRASARLQTIASCASARGGSTGSGSRSLRRAWIKGVRVCSVVCGQVALRRAGRVGGVGLCWVLHGVGTSDSDHGPGRCVDHLPGPPRLTFVSQTVRTGADWRPCPGITTEVGGAAETCWRPPRRLGVKGSQVQILSSRRHRRAVPFGEGAACRRFYLREQAVR
jgi:hypothetical protein